MTRHHIFIFDTAAQARAFELGVEFVLDSSLTVVGSVPDHLLELIPAHGGHAIIAEMRDEQEPDRLHDLTGLSSD